MTIEVSIGGIWPFSALSSQVRFRIPTQVGDLGLLYMLLGEGASLYALALNRTGWVLAVLAGGGLAIGVLVVVLLVSPVGELVDAPAELAPADPAATSSEGSEEAQD